AERIDQLLQEQRHAVIDDCGNADRREAFCHLFPAAPDQLVTIRIHELVEHHGTELRLRKLSRLDKRSLWRRTQQRSVRGRTFPSAKSRPSATNCRSPRP